MKKIVIFIYIIRREYINKKIYARNIISLTIIKKK